MALSIQQVENFQVTGLILIRDNQVVSGAIPDFLQGTVETAKAEGNLEDVLTYYCNGVGNQVSLRDGYGLVIVPNPPTLDADDPDLSDLLTDRALKKTAKAIAQSKKAITSAFSTWASESASLTEIRDRIPQLYATLNSPALAKQLHESMQLGYLGGRAEILDETAADGNANDGVPQ